MSLPKPVNCVSLHSHYLIHEAIFLCWRSHKEVSKVLLWTLGSTSASTVSTYHCTETEVERDHQQAHVADMVPDFPSSQQTDVYCTDRVGINLPTEMGGLLSMQSKLFVFLEQVKKVTQWKNKGGRLRCSRYLQHILIMGLGNENLYTEFKETWILKTACLPQLQFLFLMERICLSIIHYNCTEKVKRIICWKNGL